MMNRRSGNSDGRVPVFQTGWRGFDPHPLHWQDNVNAAVAQVAERRSRKAEVAGSWPACGSCLAESTGA